MKPWTKKYQPNSPLDVIGQTSAIAQIQSKLTPLKPLLLYGPTGTGKTSIIYAIGKEQNYDIFELNASESRNKKSILGHLGNNVVQQSLFSPKKIILIDDIDTLSGVRDRGGMPALISLFPKTKFPIVFTCTDPWIDKMSKLRKKCTLIEFKSIKKLELENYLKNICIKENIVFKEEDISIISKKAQGDLRAAINDLQTHCVTGELIIDDQGERNRHEDIQYCLRKVFKSKKWEEVHNIFQKVDFDTRTCMMWLDENIPKEYNGESLKKAYNYLSKADVYNGRIRRWQHWRFLVYINTLITSGIAFSKVESNINFSEYKRSGRILQLWLAKQRNAKKKSICEKIALATHTSKKQAIKSSFPYLKRILLQPKIMAELELDEDEVAWLKK
jgi:replication factor C large subunit